MDVKKFSDKQLKMAREFVRKFDCENLPCDACIFCEKTMWCAIFSLDCELNERQNRDRDVKKDCSKI